MDYSLPRTKTKAEKVMSKIQKKHQKNSVDKILKRHQHEAKETPAQEKLEHK